MITDAKITAADIVGKLLSELPDEPELPAAQMKDRFDALPVLVKDRLNLLINELITTYASKADVEAAMTGTVTATTSLEAVTVNRDAFKIAVNNASGTYSFTYNGSAWKLNGNTVTLSSYGISIIGIPDSGDTVTVLLSFTSAENVMSKADYVDEGGTGVVLKAHEAENGIGAYTCATTGSVHALTGSGNVGVFTPDSDYIAGNTMTVNGNQMTAVTYLGEGLTTGSFKAGAPVLIMISDTTVTLFAAGDQLISNWGKLKIGNTFYGASYDSETHTLTFS